MMTTPKEKRPPKMNLKICRTATYSILEISRALCHLNWSHVINSAANRRASSTKRGAMKVKVGDGKTYVFVADGLRSIQARRGVIIVVDSASALAHTNIPRIPDDRPLVEALRALPNLWRTDVEIKKPKVMDYVNKAVKPSFLTSLQTAIYKISNHGLRKEAQGVIIAHLNSKASARTMNQVFRRNYALEALEKLMLDPQVQVLREAVAMFRATEDEKAVAAKTGCTTFDILYLVRSYDKSVATAAAAEASDLSTKPKKGKKGKSK